MANKELDLQKRIIDRLKLEGGHGHKWATEWTVGVPDLVLAHSIFGLALVEAKLEVDWRINTTRTIQLTELQRLELQKYQDAGAKVACIVGVTRLSASRYMRDLTLCPYGIHHAGPIERDLLLDKGFNFTNNSLPGFAEWLNHWL